MQKTFQSISIPKLPVFTTEEGIKTIKNNLHKLLVEKFKQFNLKFYSKIKCKKQEYLLQVLN